MNEEGMIIDSVLISVVRPLRLKLGVYKNYGDGW